MQKSWRVSCKQFLDGYHRNPFHCVSGQTNCYNNSSSSSDNNNNDDNNIKTKLLQKEFTIFSGGVSHSKLSIFGWCAASAAGAATAGSIRTPWPSIARSSRIRSSFASDNVAQSNQRGRPKQGTSYRRVMRTLNECWQKHRLLDSTNVCIHRSTTSRL